MIDKIEVFTQNSIRIKSDAATIYVDPFEMKEEPHDADFVLITHQHYDHFSPDDIIKISSKETILVVPAKMEGKAKSLSSSVKEIRTVKPGEHVSINELELETVRSYNILKPFHPKMADWVGYILTLDGKRIYIAGDTDLTKEAKAVKCDIAMVPIGGFYTMDVKKAAELVNQICSETAIPVHYGNIIGKPSDGEAFAKLVKEPIKVEIKIR